MLTPGILIKRYKRFLADIEILNCNGESVIITAHCPNSGSMLDVAEHGTKVWIAPSTSPTAKLDWQWQLVENHNGCLIGINTNQANNIVLKALQDQKIKHLSAYTQIKREVPYGTNSRVDFVLSQTGLVDCYLEVKSVHMSRQVGIVQFPDAVTKRGTKHMHELTNIANQGLRAEVLFLVQRNDCHEFSIAKDIDPDYYTSVLSASQNGVGFSVYDCGVTKSGCINVDKMIEFKL